jgi:predicted molibdopterin-dependent oxidoreductase YjgC
MSSEDGERFGVPDGEWVRLKSKRGELEGRVLYSDKMRKGEVFVPFVKLEKHAANFLTNSAFDPESKIPEYKVCAVRVEKIDNTSSRKKRLIAKESATA